LLRQIIKKMPKTGDVRVRIPDIINWRIPTGQTYVNVESGRGEMGYHVVSDGSMYPRRIHVKGASYTHAMSVLEKLAVGNQIADVYALTASVQTCPPEIER
jgi:NADH-quinone oxidoreductase subunit D